MKFEELSAILKEVNNLRNLDRIELIKTKLREKDPDIYQEWEDDGFDINHVFNGNAALLHLAAEYGCKNVVDTLIQDGADVNAKDYEEWTPLHYAADGGYVEIANALMEKGTDLNVYSDYNKDTPLHLAAESNHIEIVDALVAKGADLNVKNEFKYTPLHLAAEKGHIEIAKLLIENGAEIDAIDIDGNTPLHCAAGDGHVEMAKLLIKSGAEVNKEHHYGHTPLHRAILHSHKKMVKLLIESGADIDTVDVDHLNISSAFGRDKMGTYEPILTHIAKLEATSSSISQKTLQFKFEIEGKIFLYNHQPLIDVLSERYECDFQKMTFADVKTFFQEHRNDITVELAGIERYLIDFADFEDVKEIHIPKLELYVFTEAVKNHTLSTRLDNLNIEQRYIDLELD